MNAKLYERREFRDLVSPYLCEALLEAGIPNLHKVHWMLTPDDEWKLWSYAFDPDGVYEESDQLIYALNPAAKPLRAVQAFSTGDMLAALPPILITSSSQTDYEVSVDVVFGQCCKKGKRLPDALAELLLELLKQGVYKVDYVTEKICLL